MKQPEENEFPKFASLEETTKLFPRFCTATLHTFRPLARHEVTLLHRGQMQSIGSSPPLQVMGNNAVAPIPVTEPNHLDLIELRGTKDLDIYIPLYCHVFLIVVKETSVLLLNCHVF